MARWQRAVPVLQTAQALGATLQAAQAMDRITGNDPRATACRAPCVRGLVAWLSRARPGAKTGADFHHWAADRNRRAGAIQRPGSVAPT